MSALGMVDALALADVLAVAGVELAQCADEVPATDGIESFLWLNADGLWAARKPVGLSMDEFDNIIGVRGAALLRGPLLALPAPVAEVVGFDRRVGGHMSECIEALDGEHQARLLERLERRNPAAHRLARALLGLDDAEQQTEGPEGDEHGSPADVPPMVRRGLLALKLRADAAKAGQRLTNAMLVQMLPPGAKGTATSPEYMQKCIREAKLWREDHPSEGMN